MSFVWKILPWLLKIVWDVAREVLQDLKFTFLGWHTTAKTKSIEWRRKVMEERIITQDHDKLVKWIFYVLVYATLVASWILPPLIAVWIFRRLF